MSGGRRAYFTICSLNYMAYALTLHESLNTADADSAGNFVLILADEPDNPEALSELPFEVILAKDLGIPTFWDMAMRYSIMEFNTAIKPAAFKHLMTCRDYSEVVYLDPDIFVVSELSHVHDALSSGVDIVLTPHTTEPLEDGYDPDDLRIMQTGVYNLGFLGCRRSEATLKLLDWWDRRMVADCRVDLENGIFVDQKFMDLAPAFCEAVSILRHPGYNIAYWNLPSRRVTCVDGEWSVNDQSAHFFHFSGIVPGDPTIFSKHQNRYTAEDIGELWEAFLEYLGALARNGHETWRTTPYRYGTFTDGTPIPSIYRSIYQKYVSPTNADYSDVFQADYDLLEEPAEDIEQTGELKVSRVMQEIWEQRPDLRQAFPSSNRQGREAMARWFVASATTEYGLPELAYRRLSKELSASNLVRRTAKPGSKLSQLKRIVSRSAVSIAPTIRPVYRSLPRSWRIKARDSLLNSAAQPSYAAILKGGANREFNPSLATGIDIYGYFSTVSGVGEGARRTALALEKAGIPHQKTEVSIDGGVVSPPSSQTHRVALFHLNADQTPRILDSIGPSRLKGQYRIGYWAWEIEEFPEAWCLSFEYLDEIWVPSEFVRASVAKKTEKPVHMVPHPVEPEPMPRLPQLFGLPEQSFLILCAVDLRSFEARKNPRGMVEAFRLAFPEPLEADPILVVKMSGRETHRDSHAAFTEFIEDDRNIFVIDDLLSDEDWNTLKSSCDAFLSLHRSEGFGLSIAEMMALGKPVVATDYGGSTDFLSHKTGFPVQYSKVPIQPGEYPESAGQMWADADLQQAADYLREISEGGHDSKRADAAAQFLKNHYSLDSIAARITNRFGDIMDKNFG